MPVPHRADATRRGQAFVTCLNDTILVSLYNDLRGLSSARLTFHPNDARIARARRLRYVRTESSGTSGGAAMRVIAGEAKGRALRAAGAATRPITDRVKENLFNILGARVVGATVLDLFAGAGSVGIEALSRGARAATFVELDREALRAIRANLDATRLGDRARVVRLDAFRFIRHADAETFDLIYVAPPQYKGLWAETLHALDQHARLTARGIVVAQIHPKEYQELALTNLELFDRRKYGSTLLCFYRSKAITSSSLVCPNSA